MMVDAESDRVLVPNMERTVSEWERTVGLLGRYMLAEDSGLCIDRCRMIHTIGMRFAIDIVYGDAAGRVQKVVASIPPWRLSACWHATWVVELASGMAKKRGIVPGMHISFRGSDHPI